MKSAKIISWIILFLASIAIGYIGYGYVPNQFAQFQALANDNPRAIILGKILGIALAIYLTTFAIYWLVLKMYQGWFANLFKRYPLFIPWLIWVIVVAFGLFGAFGYQTV